MSETPSVIVLLVDGWGVACSLDRAIAPSRNVELVQWLRLSIRTIKALRKANVNTVEELVRMSGNDVLDIHNIGITGLNDIRNALAAKRLALRGEDGATS